MDLSLEFLVPSYALLILTRGQNLLRLFPFALVLAHSQMSPAYFWKLIFCAHFLAVFLAISFKSGWHPFFSKQKPPLFFSRTQSFMQTPKPVKVSKTCLTSPGNILVRSFSRVRSFWVPPAMSNFKSTLSTCLSVFSLEQAIPSFSTQVIADPIAVSASWKHSRNSFVSFEIYEGFV